MNGSLPQLLGIFRHAEVGYTGWRTLIAVLADAQPRLLLSSSKAFVERCFEDLAFVCGSAGWSCSKIAF